MVAAWMRAETGVGPSIASGQPGLQRELAGLAAGAEQQQQRDRQRACSPVELADAARTPRRTASVPSVANMQEDRDGQADVADPVHEERLLAGGGRGRAVLVPEADQQVRRETDALPADVEHHEVVAEHQQQHRRDEQVEVARRTAAGPGRAPCSRPRRCGSAKPTPVISSTKSATAGRAAARSRRAGRRRRSSRRATAHGVRWSPAASAERVEEDQQAEHERGDDGGARRASGPTGRRAGRRAAARARRPAGSAISSQASPADPVAGADLRQLGQRGASDTGSPSVLQQVRVVDATRSVACGRST